MSFSQNSSFIDGTVEGTNIKFIDSDKTHNHTYFGNGGNNVTTAGPTNLTTTYDNEEQSIGTYYNFQAASSGSGAAVTTENAIIPDTFCPLGWQLPYGGTGGDYYDKSRSWSYLLATYGIDVSIESELQNQKTRSYPMSIILTGNYYWDQGVLQYFNVHTLLHSATIYGPNSTYQMYIWNNKVNYQSHNSRTNGMSARCVFGISNLESFPWHPRSLISIMAFHFLKAHFPSVKIMSNYLKNETKYFIFKELRANFDEAESKYKMENRILMSELQDAREKL